MVLIDYKLGLIAVLEKNSMGEGEIKPITLDVKFKARNVF